MGIPILDIRNFFKRKKRINTLEVIHSQESFRMILDRERARAERTGHIFSLVLFGFNHGKETDSALLEQLGSVLVNKVRMSDEVGWYEEGKSMGALLPGTTADGASQFIEIIREKVGKVESRLESSVYTYPNSLKNSDGRTEEAYKNDTCLNPMPSVNLTSEYSPISPLNGKCVKPMEVLFVRPIPYWKRLIDIFVAILLLVFLSPLFLLIALFIKIVSPGPVFYRQERIGYMGRKFTFWKFRTMHVNNDEKIHLRHISRVIEKDTPIGKLDDLGDNRIIPMGKFLRKFCLDEFPQLLNVLLGDMSLVGPRPCLDYEADKFLQWQKRRFNILPGMSGLWQVSGKNRTTFKEMVRLDIRYSRRLSPGLDAKILFFTVPAILGMVFDSFAKKMAIGKESPTVVSSHKNPSLPR
jgi:lipopolysaccharide/colanic/teichoic acid biosynthesis glycosyltransferase